jgi:hypothetical protein
MMHLRMVSITIDPEHGRRDAAGLAGDFQTIALRAQRQARAACSQCKVPTQIHAD